MYHERSRHWAKTHQDSHETEPRRDMELRDSSQDKTWIRRDWDKTETCKYVSRDETRVSRLHNWRLKPCSFGPKFTATAGSGLDQDSTLSLRTWGKTLKVRCQDQDLSWRNYTMKQGEAAASVSRAIGGASSRRGYTFNELNCNGWSGQ